MNQTAYNCIAHYLSKGLTKNQAVAPVAVFMVESSLNPTAENNTGTETPGAINPHGSYGLAQWNGPRQEALASFAKVKGLAVSDLYCQLDFFLTESANSYASVWAGLTNPAITYAQLISTIVTDYERPANIPAEITKAMIYGAEFYAYAVTPAPGVPVPAPAPAPVPAPSPIIPTVPPIPGDSPLNAVVAAALEQLIPLLVPLLAPTVESIFAELTAQLGPIVQQTIAAELAKLTAGLPKP